MEASKKKPKIGLALAGASARAIFYVGFLEVLAEQKISIDYISACSSGAIVAASFASGTLPELKNLMLGLDKNFVFSLLDKAHGKGGYYSLDRAEEFIKQFTNNKTFEEVKPNMGFLAADLERGEQVVLSMGDLARAVRISCTIPALFEPVTWGNKILVDGGLMSMIPGHVARVAGMDIVIGINLRSTKYILGSGQIFFKKTYNAFKKAFLINYAEDIWEKVRNMFRSSEDMLQYYSDFALLGDDSKMPGMFTVLGKSLDLAIGAENRDRITGTNFDCDVLIWADASKYGAMDFSRSKEIYQLGRDYAEKYVPDINKRIETWEGK